MYFIIVSAALLIIAGLAFYAGSLLFKLNAQRQLRQQKTQQRIDRICESIQTIAMAIEQQQCNLSEGAIRLCNLLDGLPILDKPNFAGQFPALYSLYEQVRDLPTHQARKEQTRAQTKKQDLHREELEAQLESQILNEVSNLSGFTI